MGEDNPEIEYALQYFGFTPFMFYQDCKIIMYYF